MPRQLDHYGMDLSGFGRAFGGGSGGNQAGVTADGGIVIPKESLFRKKINFDANGNPLTDSANGRDLFAQLAIQKRLREAKLGDTKDVLNTMSGNKVNETKSEIEGKSNAELKHLAAKSGEDRKTRDTSAEHQAAMAHLNAIAPHLSDTAKAEAMASISTSNKTARESDSKTADFFKKANDADLSIKDATANHLNQLPIGQGGTAIMGKGGNIASLLQPANNNILSKIGASGFPEQQQVITPASVQNSMYNEFGAPGSGFNKAAAPGTTNYPPDNTTVPYGSATASLLPKPLPEQTPAPSVANNQLLAFDPTAYTSQLGQPQAPTPPDLAGEYTKKLIASLLSGAQSNPAQVPFQNRPAPNSLAPVRAQQASPFQSLPPASSGSVGELLKKLGLGGSTNGYTPYKSLNGGF